MIEELRDQDGNEVQIVYEVRLSYVVNACAPCNLNELVGLVRRRIEAADGVQVHDVSGSSIIAVEEI